MADPRGKGPVSASAFYVAGYVDGCRPQTVTLQHLAAFGLGLPTVTLAAVLDVLTATDAAITSSEHLQLILHHVLPDHVPRPSGSDRVAARSFALKG